MEAEASLSRSIFLIKEPGFGLNNYRELSAANSQQNAATRLQEATKTTTQRSPRTTNKLRTTSTEQSIKEDISNIA
jgi:hypothetical protein